MTELSRRSAVLALFGSAAAAGAWLTRDAGSADPPGGSSTSGSAFAGAVAVLGSRREALVVGGGHAGHGAATAGMGHHGWSETVVADVEVRNPTRRAILVSPGQFRLRVGGGPSVTFYDSERRLGVLPPGRRVRMWVSYLAPPEPASLSLEYTGAGAGSPRVFDLAPSVVSS